MKPQIIFIILSGLVGCGTVRAQVWPDYYLTNDTHYTSYGVEVYDPANPVKNLHIDPFAILQAGGTELDDIYDGNQVYLSGGTVHASAIDANDFTWNSGNLHLNGGAHSTTYGLGGGSGKDLWVGSGSTLHQATLEPIPAGNRLLLHEGKMTVAGDFDASMDGFYMGLYSTTLEVGGTFNWAGVKSYDEYGVNANRTIRLTGSGANWNCGNLWMGNSHSDENITSVVVSNGAQLSGSVTMEHTTGAVNLKVVGAGSLWNAGSIVVGEESQDNRLTVSGGGVVSGSVLSIGNYIDGNNNLVEILGEDSRLNMDSITVGERRGSYNQMLVADGGSVSCGSAVIAAGLRGSDLNGVEVRGDGSRWDIAGGITMGVGGWGNFLKILDGGMVSSTSILIGVDSGGYLASRNTVTVSGAGSKWVNSGIITIGDSVNGGPPESYGNMITITNGGEVVAQGGIVINYANGNGVNVDLGGRLVVGTAFDASMEGFHFNSGSELSVEGQLSGLATLGAGCRLETANLLGDLTVHGTFAPGNSPSDSTMHGALVIAADGTLEMELGGYALGAEYDRLTVTGLSSLDGTLDVLFLDSFSPTNGTSFDLFDWDGGVSGAFAGINTPALSGGLHWDTSELYATGQLSVIPEPGSVGLMGIGSGILLFARRHRRRRKIGASIKAERCACDTFDRPAQGTAVPHRDFWDSLISLDRLVDRAKAAALRCFDALLALVMK